MDLDKQTDWREMPAGKELDELICKMVGWTISINPLGNSATLWTPDMKIVNTWGSSEAWPNVVAIAWNNAPRYSRDAEAALMLPLNPESWFELVSPGWNNKEWGCKILEHDVSKAYPAPLLIHNMEYRCAPTAALAVCRAWLTWKHRNSRK